MRYATTKERHASRVSYIVRERGTIATAKFYYVSGECGYIKPVSNVIRGAFGFFTTCDIFRSSRKAPSQWCRSIISI